MHSCDAVLVQLWCSIGAVLAWLRVLVVQMWRFSAFVTALNNEFVLVSYRDSREMACREMEQLDFSCISR